MPLYEDLKGLQKTFTGTTKKCENKNLSQFLFQYNFLKCNARQVGLTVCTQNRFRCTPCTWKIVHIKEQTCTLLIITWYGDRNCTKLVLKPLAAKNGLSVSVLYIAPFLQIILFQFTWWLPSIFTACTLHYVFT